MGWGRSISHRSLPAGSPPPAVRWTGLAKYNFTGGNNDADQVPVDGLIAAASAVLRREGRNSCDLRSRAAGRRATGRCASSWSESSSATPASPARPTTS